MTSLLIAVGIAYMILTLWLIAFGANLMWFSLIVWRRGRLQRLDDTKPATLTAELLKTAPRVTVQIPIYNELYVSERVIAAVCALDYPRELMQIQVLDDSTDATRDIVARVVADAKAQQIDIVHIHRTERDGYKAGALKNGMLTATGEFLAIFDADFVPEPDFLIRALPYFDDDNVAFVQGRWGHFNRDQSWLTRIQSLAIDGHFMVEQACRGVRGYWFNFNGTAGIWRAAAIDDAGGWQARTLTEDLDLSYRAHLRGWRGHFVEDLVVPSEVPAQMSGFRRQQHRWARGSLECAKKLLPEIWRSDERLAVKYQATMHLTSYAIHLLLFGVALLNPFVVLAAHEYPQFRTFFGIAYLFAVFSLAPILFFITGQRQLGNRWWRQLHRIGSVALIGPGLMLNTVRAAFEIWRRPNPEFERTAKFGLMEVRPASEPWTQKRYQLAPDRIVFGEAIFGLYSLATAGLALRHNNWGVFTYSAWFGIGLLAVAGISVAQTVALRRQRTARDAQRRDEDRALAGTAGTVTRTS